MSLFVDTSVWSLALRRDTAQSSAPVAALKRALEEGQTILTAGFVLQELLQGFSGPKASALIREHFAAIPLLAAERADHIEAAELRNRCHRAGVHAGTIEALMAHLCVRHDLTLLSSDRNFENIAKHAELKLWGPGP